MAMSVLLALSLQTGDGLETFLRVSTISSCIPCEAWAKRGSLGDAAGA